MPGSTPATPSPLAGTPARRRARASARCCLFAVALGVGLGGAAAGCSAHYAEPLAHEEHGHLVIFNLSRGGRVVAYHVSDGRSRKMAAFFGPDTYRYVRLPPGPNAVRFEVEVGGVLYESKVFDVTGDSSRLVAVGVAGPKTVFREIGGPRAKDFIERARSGSPFRWDEVE
ncbi:MAG TPA: hypothetical protein VG389_26460 [Myxococcota bacterium]|nr:hypothetical protein [Myxococcota bacterium]